jgi:hypothetical protein
MSFCASDDYGRRPRRVFGEGKYLKPRFYQQVCLDVSAASVAIVMCKASAALLVEKTVRRGECSVEGAKRNIHDSFHDSGRE